MRVEHLLKASAERAGARIAVAAGRGRYTYRDLDRQSDRFARALAARLMPGDRVALHLEDGFPAVVAAFGILKAGMTVAPLPAPAAPERLQAWLSEQSGTAIVTEARYGARVAEAISGAGALRLVILIGGDRATAGGSCLAYEDIVERIDAGALLAQRGEGEAAIFAGADSDPDIFTHADLAGAATIGAPHPDATVQGADLATHDGFHQMMRTIAAGATLVLDAARYGRRAERTRAAFMADAGASRLRAIGGWR